MPGWLIELPHRILILIIVTGSLAITAIHTWERVVDEFRRARRRCTPRKKR
jgi:hypothetical protein